MATTSDYKMSNTNTAAKLAVQPTNNNKSNMTEFAETIVFKIIAAAVWPWVQIFEIVITCMYILFAPLRIWKLFFQTTVATLLIFVQSVEGFINGNGLSEFINKIRESSAIRSYIKQLKEIFDDILGYKPTENGNVNPPIENSTHD